MDWFSRYLFCIVLSVLKKMSSSEVKVAGNNLTWRKANDACRLISFSQVKSENELFVQEMVINSNYWIKDLVEEFTVVMKGCHMAVSILTSKAIESNLLLNCFQFCQKYSITTIGIKENNCSCLSKTAPYPSGSDCDVLCVWEGRSCKATKTFSVFQKNYIINFGGFKLEECVVIHGTGAFKINCSSKEKYLCQNNEWLNKNLKEVTWIEAVSKCAEQNQTLAFYPPRSSEYDKFKEYRYWIGSRQYFHTKPVQQGSSMCLAINRFTDKDIKTISVNCEEENKYICLKDQTTVARKEIVKTSYLIETNDDQTTVARKEIVKTSVEINDGIGIVKDSSSSEVVRIVIGILAFITTLILVIICLFKRRRNNSRSAYQSPVVEYSTVQRRDSKQSQTKSVKSSPLKPARRSKKAKPDSLVSGTEYENIVLTFEDPSTISRVVSSTSTDRTEILKEEENYDVMNTGNKKTSSNVISQNVYGFSPPEGEYDVMNRDNRNVNEFNPDYDHM